MNYSPYEIRILLEVHCGMTIDAHRNVLFHKTMDDFIKRGLVCKIGESYVAGDNLNAVVEHVLQAPRPMPIGHRARLTARQSEIFDFVKSHATTKGMPPTRIEIADRFGFNSANAAEDHLRALERKGYIKLGTARARSIRIIP